MNNALKNETSQFAEEQKQRAGIFAVRCMVSGEVWVSKTCDLEKRQEGVKFQLGLGGFSGKSVQAAWDAHGEAAFDFLELQEMNDNDEAALCARLRDREGHWRLVLGAQPLF